VPRQRLDLLPQYARIAASLSTVAMDPKASVAAQLAGKLKMEFRSMLRRKATAALRRDLHDVRLKNARYIAELTKFGHRFGAPPLLALSAVKACCEDFSGANVDVACAILEGCGRYLLNTKVTKAKTEKLLAAILKLKVAKNLDPSRRALVDNAFYACRPPLALKRGERAAAKAKRLAETPLVERYAKNLLLERLHPSAATKAAAKAASADPSSFVAAANAAATANGLDATSKAGKKAAAKAATAAAAAALAAVEDPVEFVLKQLRKLPWKAVASPKADPATQPPTTAAATPEGGDVVALADGATATADAPSADSKDTATSEAEGEATSEGEAKNDNDAPNNEPAAVVMRPLDMESCVVACALKVKKITRKLCICALGKK